MEILSWFLINPDMDVGENVVQCIHQHGEWVTHCKFVTFCCFQIFFGQEEEEIQNRTKSIDSLKTALRTQPMRCVFVWNLIWDNFILHNIKLVFGEQTEK